MREVMTQLHQGNHWGIQAMYDAILRAYVYPGIYTLAKQIFEGCLTCKKLTSRLWEKEIQDLGLSRVIR
jgi:hypothetical protein